MSKLFLLPVLCFFMGCTASHQDAYFSGYVFPEKLLEEDSSTRLGYPDVVSESVLKLGDTFVFNNPNEQWAVTTVGEKFVTWSSPDGGYMKTSKWTFLPPLEWGGRGSVEDSGRREFSRLSFDEGVNTLEEGASYSFTEKRRNDRPPSVMTSEWYCALGANVEITVPAGKTNAVQILCTQDGVNRLLMNYSPSLGYAVRHVLSTTNGPVVRELTGYQRTSASDNKN